MSGFVGILNLDGAPVQREQVQRLTDALTFRGPDAQAIWVDGPIGLGHTLLRTTDEAQYERQPLTLDDQVWIVADGRVDARQELIAKLAAREGIALEAARTPDVELILRSYLSWGSACLDQLLGDFSFAIWDGRRRMLFCAHDQLGIKPFYYAQVGSCLIVSNTLNCVREHPLVSKRVNDQAMGDALLFGSNYDLSTTFFADIRRLPGGHFLTASGHAVRQQRYWALPIQEILRYKQPDAYVEHFKQLMGEAVADRLRMPDVSLLLSGGHDSTTIAAFAIDMAARRNQTLNLHPITGLFDRMANDQEEVFARAVATALNIHPRLIHFEPDLLRGVWKRPDHQLPEPFFMMVALGTVLSSARVDPGRVLLFGHGSDLTFQAVPQTVLSMLRTSSPGAVATDLLSTHRLLRSRPPFGLGIVDWVEQRRHPRPADAKPAGQSLPGVLHPLSYPTWLNKDFERDAALPSRWNHVFQTAWAPIGSVRAPAYSAIGSSREIALYEWLDPSFSLMNTDVRMPFLDLRVLQYLLTLPPYPWVKDKGMLRIAMRGRLPTEVLERPKTSLPRNPLQMLLANDMEPLAQVAAMPELREYIDVRKLVELGESAPIGWAAPVSLRLLSIGYWLRYRA